MVTGEGSGRREVCVLSCGRGTASGNVPMVRMARQESILLGGNLKWPRHHFPAPVTIHLSLILQLGKPPVRLVRLEKL